LRSQEIAAQPSTDAIAIRPIDVNASGEYPIDYTADKASVRAQIAALSDEQARTAAYNEWGDKFVKQEREQAGPFGKAALTADDYGRSFARGVPFVGGWLDELNALMGSGSYDENVAYQRARDRDFQERHPYANFGTQTAGAVLSPGGYLKGVGVAGNVLYSAIQNLISGAGEGEDTLANRAVQGGVQGAVGGATSWLLSPLAKYATSRNRADVTPGVEQALNDLQVKAPWFLQASDPAAQAAGRRYAQVNVGSPLDMAYRGVQRGVENASDRIVQGATGAPTTSAPNVVGGQLAGGMGQASRDVGTEMEALAQQIRNLFPSGYRGDPAMLRDKLQKIAAERARDENPIGNQGLEWGQNIVKQPGGTMWDTLMNFRRAVGEQLRGRDAFTPPMGNKDELSGLYGATMDDARNIVQGVAGPAGLNLFTGNTAQQAALARVRDSLGDAARGLEPEQIINQIYNAATLNRSGTRLDVFQTMMNALSPAQREMAGGAVLAKIVNDTLMKPIQQAGQQAAQAAPNSMNPAAVAKALGMIEPSAFATLFPPGSQLAQQVNALRVAASRVGQVNDLQHVGGAKTLGERLASAAVPTANLAIAGLGHLFDKPMVTSAALGATALGAIRKGLGAAAQTLEPFALQHGLSPGTVGAVNRGVYGGPRGIASAAGNTDVVNSFASQPKQP
jgi:hypothetical protein